MDLAPILGSPQDNVRRLEVQPDGFEQWLGAGNPDSEEIIAQVPSRLRDFFLFPLHSSQSVDYARIAREVSDEL